MIYGNADGFKEYLGSRGMSMTCSWTDDKINSALLVASEWLDGLYEDSWIGYKADGYKQERSWPRKSAQVQSYPFYTFKEDEIPEQVVKATYEAAYRHLNNNNALQTDYTPTKYKRVSVSGAVSVEYNDTTTGWTDVQTQFPIIQTLMSDLIDDDSSGSFSSLSGKAVRL